MQWLNTMVLVGQVDKRGEAWHYRAALQGTEPNSYPGFIPVEDVRRRLFGFTVEPQPLFVRRSDFEPGSEFVEVPGRKAWTTSDTGDVLGIFSDGYRGHQYDEWLVRNVENLLDDGLGIGSAGLLRNRAQAWVSIEASDNIMTPEGVEFRPNLVAATSFDGSLATTYKRTVTNVVCDNTLAAGLGERHGQVYRVKHTRYSKLRIADARDALGVIHQAADEFAAEVARLGGLEVSRPQFAQWLDVVVPMKAAGGEVLQGKALTLAEHKRDALADLYFRDDRAAPWAGTGLGVLQAFNTYQHHLQTVRGASRVQRNGEAAITGRYAEADGEAIKALELVLAA